MTDERTIIQTRIEGESYVATTPHAPDLSGEGPTEARAVNVLMAAIRQLHAQHPDGSPWIVNPKVGKSKDAITRRITGLWPTNIKPSKPEETGDERKD